MNPEQFLEIISPNKDDPTVFKLGSIPAGYVSGRPTVLFDGESVASVRTYPCLSSYVPAANDRVVLALVSHVFTVIGKIDSGASPWIPMTLLNGWVDYGGGYNTSGYYKDSSGIVHVRGLIKSGTFAAGTPVFNLPVGYRPIQHFMLPAFSYNGAGVPFSMEIHSDGLAIISSVAAGNTWLSLDSLQFRAEQ